MTEIKGWLTIKKPVYTWDLEEKAWEYTQSPQNVAKAFDKIQNLYSVKDLVIKMGGEFSNTIKKEKFLSETKSPRIGKQMSYRKHFYDSQVQDKDAW